MNNIIKSENVIMQGKTTEKTDIHKEICGELNKIYEAKNKDYGDTRHILLINREAVANYKNK